MKARFCSLIKENKDSPEAPRKETLDQQIHLAVVRDLGINPLEPFRWEPLCFGIHGKADRLELKLSFPDVSFVRLIGQEFGRYCELYRYTLACLWWSHDPERPIEICEFLSEGQKCRALGARPNREDALRQLVRERWEFIVLQATLSEPIFIERFYHLLMQVQFESTRELIRSADDLYSGPGFDAGNNDDTRPKSDPSCDAPELERVKSLVGPPRILSWDDDDNSFAFQVDSISSHGQWYPRRELGTDTIELYRNGDVKFQPRQVISENLNRPYSG